MSAPNRKHLNLTRLTTELADPEEIQHALTAKKQTASAPAEAFVPPNTPAEKKVAEIWARTLGLERVGLHDDFFKLGGHSLLATQVLSEVSRAFDIALPTTLAYGPEFTIAAVVNALTQSGNKPTEPPLQRIETQPSYPLSFGQQRLWWLHQLEPDNPAYNTLMTICFTGPLNSALLERSLNDVLQRHEGLRTVFIVEAEQPRQVIRPVLNFKLSVVDLRHLPESEQEPEARQRAVLQTQEPFNLSNGPLLRVTLVRLREDEHWLLVAIHHIIGDGWSAQVLIQDLASAYQAHLSGEPSAPLTEGAGAPLPELAELALRYIDYADWQRERLQGVILEDHLTYWQQRLAGLSVLALPIDHPRPPRQTFRGETQWIDIDSQLTEALRTIAQREGASFFMLLLAAFQVLLSRYTGQEDIVVGTPVANRTRPELERLVGFFVNSLVLRNDLSGDPTFREALRRVRAGALEAYAHQDLPFEQLVDHLRPARDLSRNPLFQVLIALAPASTSYIEFSDFNFNEVDIDTGTAKFDLSLLFKETPKGLHGAFEYNTDLFEAATIARMAAHFETLLRAIAADSEQCLSQLSLLTEAEQQELKAWNATRAEYPREHCLHELFEAQVAQTPNAIAVVFEEQWVTYAELNQRSNQLAHHLRGLGVGPETLVGICVDRSVEMVVGLLGILKAGGAYVPLDPTYPPERLAFMLEDSGVRVVLTQAQRLAASGWQLVTDRQQLTTICLDTEWETITNPQPPTANPQPPLSPENLAYLIYTSGSTGKPKGVPVSHANVVRLFEATAHWYHFTAADVWTLFHSYAFDFSVWELWGALLYGGRLVVVPYWVSRAPEVFYRLLHSEGVTVLNQTPSAFHQLVQIEQALEVPSDSVLRLVIFGGEALELHSLKPWWDRHGDQQPELVNMYGITETTVHVTYRPLVVADLNSGSVIGQTIPDLQLYLLDRHLEPVPLGVPGELYVSGAGLARGYLGRPELTAERFVPNPFLTTKDEGRRANVVDPSSFVLGHSSRLYRTGDLARRLSNGDIEYLGRIDQQVKIRGHRIELGEIEAVLAQSPGVQASVVVRREDSTGPRLVAYFVSQTISVPSPTELRHFLKIHLPDYMIPSDFVSLESLPLTPNGKVDHRALPAPKGVRSTPGDFVPPRTPLEELIVGIWAEVLHLEQVGAHDNFFEIGGHSLLATQVISRMRQALGVELPLPALFEAPTVAGVAECVQAVQGGIVPPLRLAPRGAELPLSFAQERLWFLDQVSPGSPVYNIPLAAHWDGPLAVLALEQSLNEIVRRHEVLRTTFIVVEEHPIQIIAPELTMAWPSVDLREMPAHLREIELRRLLTEEACQPFSLTRGPLIRTGLIHLTDHEYLLLLTMHHIISDGWSLEILGQELSALYELYTTAATQDLSSRVRSRLSPLPMQYADYAIWQRAWLQGEVLEAQLDYWCERLANLSVLDLPTDHSRPPVQSFRGAAVSFTLPPTLSSQLIRLGQPANATLFMAGESKPYRGTAHAGRVV